MFRGADLRYNLEITLEQAARGIETKIRIPAMSECETCKGSGAKPGTQPVDLPDLPRRRPGARVAGLLLDRADLPALPRQRQDHRHIRAPPAAGSGRIKLQKTLSVKIPAGVDEGDRIRLSGEGEAGVNGGPPGDLYVQVHIKPHAVFQRDHDDLHCEMPI